MSFTNCNKSLKSPELQSVIVEPILLSCIDGSSIDELVYAIQRILPSPYDILKKYLFHMINYELISYNGQRQIFTIDEGGRDLLEWIKKKRTMTVNSEDIVIIIE